MTITDLKIGQSAMIRAVGGQGALRRHLLDMGLTPRTRIKLCKMAPMGDPIELRLRGYDLTLRLEDAQKIEIDAETVSDRFEHRYHKNHHSRHRGVHGPDHDHHSDHSYGHLRESAREEGEK